MCLGRCSVSVSAPTTWRSVQEISWCSPQLADAGCDPFAAPLALRRRVPGRLRASSAQRPGSSTRRAGPGRRLSDAGGVAAGPGVAGPLVVSASACARGAAVRRHQARPGRSGHHRHRRSRSRSSASMRGSTRDAKRGLRRPRACTGRVRGDEAPRFRPPSGARSLPPSAEDPAAGASPVADAAARPRASGARGRGAIPADGDRRHPRCRSRPAAGYSRSRRRRRSRSPASRSAPWPRATDGRAHFAGRFGGPPGPGAARCHPARRQRLDRDAAAAP